jgi:hypothetical protein
MRFLCSVCPLAPISLYVFQLLIRKPIPRPQGSIQKVQSRFKFTTKSAKGAKEESAPLCAFCVFCGEFLSHSCLPVQMKIAVSKKIPLS